jgi:cellulose synthase/poly-beta-1,6-N-acetylglucosamine synthase-like glycosyltransferase
MIVKILNSAWIFFQIVIGYNLVVPVILYLIYLIKGRYTPIGNATNTGERDYAIIVTAYEQTDALAAVVDSIRKLNYSNYLVYIVADKCDVSGLKFDDKRIIVLRPPETIGSNTGSHFYAINHFERAHELLIIVDSDNLMHPRCLTELNRFFDAGFFAVQGLRQAKNLDTTYACLDAARDIYYHFYDGEVLFSAGSSATLAGSGMAFKTSLYRECLERLDIQGAGFDKVLQKEIVSRGYRIAFNEQAIVYDEKTSRSDQLVRQRARWINTWFRYFGFGFLLLGQGVRKFDFNRFLFGVILLRPPLFIFLILSLFCCVCNIWLSAAGLMLWGIGFACFILGFIIALVHGRADKRIIRSLINIPKFVFFQVVSLMQIKKANKISVATQHYSNKNINDIKE